MELFLLGPVEAGIGGRLINVGVRKQRFVLAMLALEVNKQVSTERLVELMWPEDPPATARGMIHNHVSGLRAVLAGTGAHHHGIRLERGGSGYVLRCDPARIDVHRFRALLADARNSDDDERRVELLNEALALWRGPALAGVAPEEVRSRLCRGLEETRLTAVEDLFDGRLRLDRSNGLLDELLVAAEEHPNRPRLTGTLMRALDRAGRTDEALETYRRSRQRLTEELGLDPPAELQELHLAILRGNPEPEPAVPMPPRPAQLPADLSAFIGRAAELARLYALFSGDGRRPSSTVVISAIDGMAGIGKTTLAVHAAHRLAPRFPDGQIFLDLHGFTEGVDPLEPESALDRMLRCLGVPGEQIPDDLDDRAGMYRSLLADKRTLVLLDNAATESQVLPLLPGAPGCVVLVTSRTRLTGLDDAHPLSLDLLPYEDALALFTRTVGEHRLSGHPSGLLTEVVELCGRLPLAIRIAAARLRARPAWTLAHLADRLRDHRHRLAELRAGQHSVTAAIDLSYRHLDPGERRMFRLLGLHPGSDIDTHAAAALADTGIQRAARLLDGLTDAHLLHEPTPGRYRFHDLLRAHAALTAESEETEPDRRAALGRLLDHYAYAAEVAMDLVYPYEAHHRPRVRQPAAAIPAFGDKRQAAAWLDAELANLLTAAGHAAAHGRPTHASHLSATLHRHLRTRAFYNQAGTLHGQALDAARAAGHREGELTALWALGYVCWLQGRYGEAGDHFEQALKTARDIGHPIGELNALTGVGHVHLMHGEHQPAIDHYEQALSIARTADDTTGEINALWGLGNAYWLQGRYDHAADRFERALKIARVVGYSDGELHALIGLGRIHRLRGRYGPAADRYRQALKIARATGNLVGELHALNGLGRIHHVRARYGPAADCHQRALDLARQIGDRNSECTARYGLGSTRHATGDFDQAFTHYQALLELACELGQPFDQAQAHNGLAHAHRAAGQYQQAREHWRRALDILTDLDQTHVEDVDPEEIRARLHDLGSGEGDPPDYRPLADARLLAEN